MTHDFMSDVSMLVHDQMVALETEGRVPAYVEMGTGIWPSFLDSLKHQPFGSYGPEDRADDDASLPKVATLFGLPIRWIDGTGVYVLTAD